MDEHNILLLQVFSCTSFRKQQQLTTLQNNFVKGHIPAMPPENFLTPADKNRRRIRPTTFKVCDSDNTIARHKICKTRGFKIPDSKTEQYKSSFLVRSIAGCNKLKTLWSLQSTARGCLPHTDNQSRNVFNKACTVKQKQKNCTDHSI